MGIVGVTGLGPITATRAVLEVLTAEVVDSKFRNSSEEPQKQFKLTLKVHSGAGKRDGEIFMDWFSFPASGDIGAKLKAGQLLTATLGAEDAKAETLEQLAEKLVGKRFVAQIGTSRDKQYPRVVHDTIGPAPVEAAENSGSDPDEDENDFPGPLF